MTIAREKEKLSSLQSRKIVRQGCEVRFRDAVERSGHQGVAALAPVLAVLQHHLGKKFLALAGQARHLLAAMERRLVAARAAVFGRDFLAFAEKFLIDRIFWRCGFQG